MTCHFPEHLLIGYLYDEIEPPDRGRVKAHLMDCHECQAILDELQSTRSELEAVPSPTLNEPLAPPTAAKPVLAWYRQSWSGWLAAAAVALLALSLAVTRMEIRSGEGYLTVSWGDPSLVEEDATPVTRGELAAWQRNAEQRLNLILAAEREQQGEILRAALNAFSERLDDQRREDLQLVGAGLEAMQWQANRRFQETDRILNDIIQTSAVPGQRRGPE